MSIYTSAKSIYTVNAICGGGKTEAALDFITSKVGKKNFVYIVPTTKLAESIYKRLASKKPDCRINVIHGDGATRRISKYFNKKHGNCGNVLIICFASWKLLPHLQTFKKLKTFQVIYDEVPPLVNNYFNISPEHFKLLREHIKPASDRSALDGIRLVSVDKTAKKLLNNGELPESLVQLFYDLTNGNMHLWVDAEHWDDLLNHRLTDDLHLVSLLNPRPFRNAIVMGANLDKSLLYNWFSRYYNYRFKAHPITKDVRTEHDSSLADCVTVKFCRHKNFSKYVMNDESGKWNSETGELIIDDITFLIQEDMEKNGLAVKPYGFTSNADFEDEEKKHDQSIATDSNAVYIPPKAHGLNDFQHLKTMVNLCAMNPTPAQQALMASLGFSYDELRYDMMIEPAHQWFLRSGARQHKPEGQYVFYAPDYATASAVATLTGGTLQFIGNDCFPYQEPMTDKERKEQERTNKFLEQYQFAPDNNKNCHESLIKKFYKGTRDTFCNSVSTSSSRPIPDIQFGMVHSVKSVKATEILDVSYDRASLVSHMKKFAKVKGNKHDTYKIIPSTLDRAASSARLRSKANVLAVNAMILDIDGGDYSANHFIEQFGKKLSFIIHGTASADGAVTSESVNNFRVILPYSKPCSLEEHKSVYEWFVQKMPNAKIDPTSKSGVSQFTLPFTGDSEPFLEFHNLSRDSQLKKCLDPYDIHRKAPAKKVVNIGKRDKKDVDVGTLVSNIRTLKEGRRVPFFKAVLKMHYAGYSEFEIRNVFEALELEIGKDWLDECFKSISRYAA